VPEVQVTAGEYAFTALASIGGGAVRFKLLNSGKEDHHLQLARLNEGVTLANLQTALAGPKPDQALALVSLPGGGGTVLPGGSASAVFELTAGRHILACFVPSADGVPHIAKGMVLPVTVAAPTGQAAKLPQPSAEAVLKDFVFELPELKAGKTAVKVINRGPQPHELSILRLAAGKTAADVLAFFQQPPSGPPLFQSAGGVNGLSARVTVVGELELTAGAYLAICLIPDPASGVPHAALGMVKEFADK